MSASPPPRCADRCRTSVQVPSGDGARARARFHAAGARDSPSRRTRLPRRCSVFVWWRVERSSLTIMRARRRSRSSIRTWRDALWPGQNAVGQTMLFGPEQLSGRDRRRCRQRIRVRLQSGASRSEAELRLRARAALPWSGGRRADPGGPGDLARSRSTCATAATSRRVAGAVGPALREVDRRHRDRRSCAPWTSSSRASRCRRA